MRKAIFILLFLYTQVLAGTKFMTGFEIWTALDQLNFMGKSNDHNGFDYVQYTGAAIHRTFDRKGNAAARFSACVTTTDPSYHSAVAADKLGNCTLPVYVNCWFYFKSTDQDPAGSSVHIFKIQNGGGDKGLSLLWRTDNKWSLDINLVTQSTSTATIPKNTWLLMQAYTTWGASGVTSTITFNGETLTSGAAIEAQSATSPSFVSVGFFDMPTNNCVAVNNETAFYADDLIVNDASGSSQNTAPDTSAHVMIALPVSDGAIGGWTGGLGGTTSLYDGVNNQAPQGSTTETDLTLIKNSNSSTTDTAYFNINDYTSSGVPAGKMVKVAIAFARHGEHDSNNTKVGTVALISNPAGSGTSFEFGNDSIAHKDDQMTDGCAGSNVCAHKYWITAFTPPSYTTAALATQPSVAIIRQTASTRQVCVDIVGVIYQYTNQSAAEEGRIWVTEE